MDVVKYANYYTFKCKLKCVPFTLKFDERGKKKMKNLCDGWQNKDFIPINVKHDSIAIQTGKNYGIFGIDFDNIDVFNGINERYNLKKLGTPYSKTPRGYHFYFKYKEKYDVIKNLTNFKEAGIDIRSNNGILIEAPTKNYKWRNTIGKYSLKEIPEEFEEELLNEIFKNCQKEVTQSNIEYNLTARKEYYWNVENEKELIAELIDNLALKYSVDYNSWLMVYFICKRYNLDFKVFDNFSKKCPEKYNQQDIVTLWNRTYYLNERSYGYGSLIAIIKKENNEIYKKLKQKYDKKNIVKTFEPIMDLIEPIMKDNNYNDKPKIKQIFSTPSGYDVHLDNKLCPNTLNYHDEDNNIIMTLMKHKLLQRLVTTCAHKNCNGKCKLYDLTEIQYNNLNQILLNNTTNNLTINGNIIINQNGSDDINNFVDNIKLVDDEELNKLLLKSINTTTPRDIAKLVFYMYYKNYIYCGDNLWYSFINNRWKKAQKNDILRLLSNEVYDFYDKIKYDECKNNIKKIFKSLSYTGSSVDVYHQMEILFNNTEFCKNIDTNKYLIGFNNGIYDLKELKFRQAELEDYITLSCNYDYNPNPSKYMPEVIKFFEDIQPDFKQREYLLKYLGSCLENDNSDETFHIFSGTTRNGKSKLAHLLELTFGDYYSTISSTLLTKERPSASIPQPELIVLKNKRIIVGSEPENNQKINTGFIKGITGRDKFIGRMLNSNEMIDFRCRFKLILLCNDIPKIDNSTDKAFWKRTRCVEFPVTFTENPVNNNEKLIDEHLDEKLVNWKQDFILLLIQYYIKYKNEKLIMTPSIEKFTESYKDINDRYLDFVKLHIMNTQIVSDYIKWEELFSLFKEWYSDKCSENISGINKKTLIEYFQKEVFKTKLCRLDINKHRFDGWRFFKLINLPIRSNDNNDLDN